MHYLSVNVLKTEPDKGNQEREGSFKREFRSNGIILLETVDPLPLKFSTLESQNWASHTAQCGTWVPHNPQVSVEFSPHIIIDIWEWILSNDSIVK